MYDLRLHWTLGLMLGLLVVASLLGRFLEKRAVSAETRATLENANERIRSWWYMVAVLAIAFVLGKTMTILLFAVISYLCLREFIGITPTVEADRTPLFTAFFVILPIQYWLVGSQWYGLYSIFIPVYAFLLLPSLAVFSGVTENFLERCAKVQWGVMLTVYCISHAPALVTLPLKNVDAGFDPVLLLLFLILVVQLSDVLQYVCGKLWGKHKLAPGVSPSKTVEGLVGGCGLAVIAGMLLSCITPFTFWQAGLLSLAIVTGGAVGGLVLSAVKRDMGAKDWGNTIKGHGGFMDRMDSVCFSAPLFFHLVRYYFT